MKKGKDFARTAFMISLAMSVIAGLVVWLTSPGVEIDAGELLMLAGVILVVGFSLVLAFRRMRDIKSNLPAEDEMSKTIKRKGAATAYYLSIYLWLALMMFEGRIDLDRSTLIGAGIMGMAVLFALSWIYHQYVKPAK